MAGKSCARLLVIAGFTRIRAAIDIKRAHPLRPRKRQFDASDSDPPICYPIYPATGEAASLFTTGTLARSFPHDVRVEAD